MTEMATRQPHMTSVVGKETTCESEKCYKHSTDNYSLRGKHTYSFLLNSFPWVE